MLVNSIEVASELYMEVLAFSSSHYRRARPLVDLERSRRSFPFFCTLASYYSTIASRASKLLVSFMWYSFSASTEASAPVVLSFVI